MMKCEMFYTGEGDINTQRCVTDVIVNPDDSYWENNKQHLTYLCSTKNGKPIFAMVPPGTNSNYLRVLRYKLQNYEEVI